MQRMVRTTADREALFAPHQDDGRTKQSFKEECDVNNILKKWLQSGVVQHLATRDPEYGDFSMVDDYQSALMKLDVANASFQSMPAKLREKFHNDPGEFIDYMGDPDNREEAIQLGLFPKPEEPRPAATPPVEDVSVGGEPPLET